MDAVRAAKNFFVDSSFKIQGKNNQFIQLLVGILDLCLLIGRTESVIFSGHVTTKNYNDRLVTWFDVRLLVGELSSGSGSGTG